MGRGPKPAKSNEATPSVARKSPKNDGARVRDLEKRLAEALEREAEALEEAQRRNRELVEAQEQQTATSEVLKVISCSTFDLQPVLETLVENAARLCGASTGLIWRFDGAVFRMMTDYGRSAEARDFWARNPISPGRGSVTGRAALERRTVHIPDVLADPDYQMAEGQRVGGYRTLLGVPMLREGALIGVFALERMEAQPFTDNQIELVTTFADQAVIAIENVRMFTELQEKNRDLTQAHAQVSEALEQQTATSEILRVISSSPTDVQPVFDAVAATASRLCEAFDAEIFRRNGDQLLLVAHHGPIPSRSLAVPLVRETFNGRAVLDGRTLHVADLPGETNEFPVGSKIARQQGSRAQLSVPLVREGVAIGTISFRRTEARLFTDRQVALLQTFADQAVHRDRERPFV